MKEKKNYYNSVWYNIHYCHIIKHLYTYIKSKYKIQVRGNSTVAYFQVALQLLQQ